MAQFDVHRTSSRQLSYPYVIVLQSRWFESASTRLVAALVEPRALQGWHDQRFAPRFAVEGLEVMLDLLNMASIPVSRLGTPVTRLDDDQSRAKIQRALDELLSQA